MKTTFRSALQVYTDGPNDLKLAAGGIAVLAAAIIEVAGSVLAALVAFFWLLDMVSGALRAVAADGLSAFRWERFAGGFAKFLAALVGIGIGVGGDLLLTEVGVGFDPLSVAAMSGIAFGFAFSALENIAFWWPGLAEAMAKAIRRGMPVEPAS